MDISHLGELEIMEYIRKNFSSEIYVPFKDKGIDFLVIKNKKFYQIQVKTSKFQKRSYFWFDLNKKKLVCDENTFYIFVCKSLDRRKFMGKKINFLAIPSLKLKRWVKEGKIILKKNSDEIYNIFIYPDMEKKNWNYRNKGSEINLTRYWNNLSFLE